MNVTTQASVRQGGDLNKRLIATTKALVREWGGRVMQNSRKILTSTAGIVSPAGD